MATVLNRTTLQILESVNTPDFSPTEWVINPDLSIMSSVPLKYIKLVDDLLVEMSDEEKIVVDNSELEKIRYEYLQVVNSCCEARIISGSGVEFPEGSGKRISTSTHAQIKWMGFANIADSWEAMGYSFPFSVRTLDDTDVITLNNSDEVKAAYAAITSFIVTTLDNAEVIKSAVQSATSKAEIYAAADGYISESPKG